MSGCCGWGLVVPGNCRQGNPSSHVNINSLDSSNPPLFIHNSLHLPRPPIGFPFSFSDLASTRGHSAESVQWPTPSGCRTHPSKQPYRPRSPVPTDVSWVRSWTPSHSYRSNPREGQILPAVIPSMPRSQNQYAGIPRKYLRNRSVRSRRPEDPRRRKQHTQVRGVLKRPSGQDSRFFCVNAGSASSLCVLRRHYSQWWLKPSTPTSSGRWTSERHFRCRRAVNPGLSDATVLLSRQDDICPSPAVSRACRRADDPALSRFFPPRRPAYRPRSSSVLGARRGLPHAGGAESCHRARSQHRTKESSGCSRGHSTRPLAPSSSAGATARGRARRDTVGSAGGRRSVPPGHERPREMSAATSAVAGIA